MLSEYVLAKRDEKCSGNKVVLDIFLLVFCGLGVEGIWRPILSMFGLVKQKIDTTVLLEKYDHFYVSIITYMEVYGYDFEDSREKEFIDELFEGGLEILEIT